MSRFCNQCGRPLKEGEVCNCSQQQGTPGGSQYNNQSLYGNYNPNGSQYQGQQYQNQQYQQYQQYQNQQYQGQQYQGQQYQGQQYQGQQYQGQQFQVPPQVSNFMTEFKLFFKRFIPFIKDPVGELGYTYKRNNISSGLYMFLSNFIMTLIYLIVLCLKIFNMASSEMEDYFGYSPSWSDISEYADIPYFSIIFGTLLVLLLYYFASSGILCGFSKIFSHNQVTFAQTLVITGSTHWYMCFFMVLAILVTIINIYGGAVIIGIGTFFTSFLSIITFCELVPMKSSNKLYTWIIYVVLSAIVLWLFAILGFGAVLSDLQNIL